MSGVLVRRPLDRWPTLAPDALLREPHIWLWSYTRHCHADVMIPVPACRPSLLVPGLVGVIVLTTAGGSPAAAAADASAHVPVRVSVSSVEQQGNRASGGPSVSADGRYVVFSSTASNLVAGDTNKASDVFVRDRRTGTTRRVSVSSAGTQADRGSNTAPLAVSADGRYVVFASPATNLVAGDRSDASDVFRRDMTTGRTALVSRSSTGLQSNRSSEYPRMTPDGRYVAFTSTATNFVPGPTGLQYEVFLRDLRTGTTSWVSTRRSGGAATRGSFLQSLSADARYIAFTSDSTDLVPGDTNGSSDVFIRDRRTGTLRRASGTGTGTQADSGSADGALSADGSRIAFTSLADNLVAGDSNGVADVFLRVLTR